MLKLSTHEDVPEGYTGTIQWINLLYPESDDYTFSYKAEYLKGYCHNTEGHALDNSKDPMLYYLRMPKYSYYLLGYNITKPTTIVIVAY